MFKQNLNGLIFEIRRVCNVNQNLQFLVKVLSKIERVTVDYR